MGSRGAQPYHCQGDVEYWAERKANYKPTPKLVLIKRAVYQSSIRNDDLPWLWQIDRRETSIDISDWEINTVPPQYSGAGVKRGEWGEHFLDWCSCYGLTSWYAGHTHKTVTTVETNEVMLKITRANLKRLGTEFYEQKFIGVDCNKYTLIQAVKQFDWSGYDTIRLGSDSYSLIYDHIKEQLDDCKIIVYKPNISFIQKMKTDNWQFIENPKGVDYFAKG